MKAGELLTITGAGRAKFRARPARPAVFAGCAALLGFSLTACTIEVGPPPESDPPLVSEAEKRPPPPEQPTEPQPWSRDLDLETGPTRIDRNVLTDGLVAEESQVTYSRERLTYESAFNPDRPPSEAELTRQRAKARAEAAGLPPPPEVAAAPVSSVSAESLPATDATPAPPQRRESRLPPPPKFPPLPPKEGEAPAGEAAVAETAPGAAETTETVSTVGEQRQSRLPPPPKFPPLPAEAQSSETARPETVAGQAAAETGPETGPEAGATPSAEQLAALPDKAAGPGPEAGDAETSAFLAEAWDAPAGTILVQVSAVPKKTKVLDEWARLKARFPQVLDPLRLVVDEAKLGEKRVFYRVQAGAFGTEEGATEVCDALIDQGQNCFVLVR